MSTTDSTAVFAADDNKDPVSSQWPPASSVWWNGHVQQLPLSVDNFVYDYPLSYDAIAGHDNGGLFYGVPALSASGNAWPMSVQTAADEATSMCSTVDAYKYQSAPSAADYAMLECYAAVADPGQALQWASVPHADSTCGASAYELCSGGAAPMPPVSVDYCNSLQMIQYDAAFGGYAMPTTNQFPSGADHIRQQAFVDKTASTRVSLYTDVPQYLHVPYAHECIDS